MTAGETVRRWWLRVCDGAEFPQVQQEYAKPFDEILFGVPTFIAQEG